MFFKNRSGALRNYVACRAVLTVLRVLALDADPYKDRKLLPGLGLLFLSYFLHIYVSLLDKFTTYLHLSLMVYYDALMTTLALLGITAVISRPGAIAHRIGRTPRTNYLYVMGHPRCRICYDSR